jgi:hypothetical protein
MAQCATASSISLGKSLGQASSFSGVDWYRSSELSFKEVIEGQRLTPDQEQKLKDIWTQARTANDKNVGVYLKSLIPDLLEERAEGLNSLHELATGKMIIEGQISEMRRKEFLAEWVATAADRVLRLQGHTDFCTNTDQAKHEFSVVEWMKLGNGLYLKGECTQPNGRQMFLGHGATLEERLEDVRERAMPYITMKTGMGFNDNEQPKELMRRMGCAQPNPLVTLALLELKEQNSAGANLGGGQEEHEWSLSASEFGDYETYVARKDARIPLNKHGLAVRPGEGSTTSVTPLDYVGLDLDRQWKDLQVVRPKTAEDTVAMFSDLAKQRQLLDENKRLIGTQVVTRWGDPQHDPNKQSEHGYHHTTVVNKITDERGEPFYILLNPAGDYINRQTGSTYKYGTQLGDTKGSGMKWTQLSHGLVQVSARDFEANFERVTVPLMHEKSSYYEGKKGLILTKTGLKELESGANIGKEIRIPGTPPPVPVGDVFIMHEIKLADPSPSTGSQVSSLGKVLEAVLLAKDSANKRIGYLVVNPQAYNSGSTDQYERHLKLVSKYEPFADRSERRRKRKEQEEQDLSIPI